MDTASRIGRINRVRISIAMERKSNGVEAPAGSPAGIRHSPVGAGAAIAGSVRSAHALEYRPSGGSVLMEELKPHRNAHRSRLVLGLFLLALGGLMLAVNLGYTMPIGWWRYFPVPLVALGLWGLVMPSRHLDRSGGVWPVSYTHLTLPT